MGPINQSTQSAPTAMAHVKLKVSGSSDAVHAFHWGVGRMDPDYPYAPPSVRRNPVQQFCLKCGGTLWAYPQINATMLKTFGKQINEHPQVQGHCKVKIVMFNVGCQGAAIDATTPAAEDPNADEDDAVELETTPPPEG